MSDATSFRSNVNSPAFEPFLVEGKPFGEVHWLRTSGTGAGLLLTGLWRHPAGTFDYTFPGDETFHVLEGRVRIRLHSGAETELARGDIASYAKGQASTWTILEPLRKFFVISG